RVHRLEDAREAAVELGIDVLDPVLQLGGSVRLVPRRALVHEVPQLMAGAMAFVEARDEEIPVFARELAEDDPRLQLRRLVEPTVHALERLARRATASQPQERCSSS